MTTTRGVDPRPVRTEDMAWIPTGDGKSFRPLRFDPDGWSELMRLDPGSVVGLHRHTGEVHAFTLAGARQILGTEEILTAGDYLHEPAGNVDSWRAVGEEPCVVHIHITGAVEYLDDTATGVIGRADSRTQHQAYLTWCAEHATTPDPALDQAPAPVAR